MLLFILKSEGGSLYRDIATSLFIYFSSYKDQSEHMQMRKTDKNVLHEFMCENTFEGSEEIKNLIKRLKVVGPFKIEIKCNNFPSFKRS